MGGYSLLMDANTLSGSLSTSVGALSEENENLKGQIIDLKEKFKAIEGDTSIMEDRLKKVEDHMVGQGI
jgi:predicted nuclease with TOPRIM domain